METSNKGTANLKDVLVFGVRDLTDKSESINADVTLHATWNQIVNLTFIFIFNIISKHLNNTTCNNCHTFYDKIKTSY